MQHKCDMDDKRPLPDRLNRTLTRIGLALTLVYGVLVVWAAIQNPESFDGMKADEWASFLAGVFAPLAFLWLVLGFFQQGHELRNSAEALRLQGAELKASVEQQRELVGVSREALEFERQQLLAQIQEAKRLAQPDLSLSIGSQISGFADHTKVRLSLLNRGRPCTDVKVLANGSHLTGKPYLPTGDTISIELALSKTLEEGPFPFTITFVSSIGENGQVVIPTQLVKDAAGGPLLELR